MQKNLVLPVVRAFFSKGMDQEVNESAHFGLGKATRWIDRVDALRFHRQIWNCLFDQTFAHGISIKK